MIRADKAHYPVWMQNETEALAVGLTTEQLEEGLGEKVSKGNEVLTEAYQKAIALKKEQGAA